MGYLHGRTLAGAGTVDHGRTLAEGRDWIMGEPWQGAGIVDHE